MPITDPSKTLQGSCSSKSTPTKAFGKSITTSVPSIAVRFHSGDDELDIYPSADDEDEGEKDEFRSSSSSATVTSSSPPSNASPSVQSRDPSPMKEYLKGLGKRSTSVDAGIMDVGSSGSDTWRIFHELKGKITKTVEEKLTEIKSDRRSVTPLFSGKSSPRHSRLRAGGNSQENSSISDSEDLSESSNKDESRSSQTNEASTTPTITPQKSPEILQPPHVQFITENEETPTKSVEETTTPESTKKKSKTDRKLGLRHRKGGEQMEMSGLLGEDSDPDHKEMFDDDIESGVEVSEETKFVPDTSLYEDIPTVDFRVTPPATFTPPPYLATRRKSSVSIAQPEPHMSLFQKILSYYNVMISVLVFLLVFFIPIPSYVKGMIVGVLMSMFYHLVVGITNWYIPKSDLPDPKRFKIPNYMELPILEIPSEETIEIITKSGGWMNELSETYNPDTYHINNTHSVYVRLNGSILRLSHPKSKIPKRHLWNERKLKMKFIHQRIYDISECSIKLLPEGMTRKRRWSKKYPLCIMLTKESKRRDTLVGVPLNHELSDPHRNVSDPHQNVSDPHQSVSDPQQSVSNSHQTVSDPHWSVTDPHQIVSNAQQNESDSLRNASGARRNSPNARRKSSETSTCFLEDETLSHQQNEIDRVVTLKPIFDDKPSETSLVSRYSDTSIISTAGNEDNASCHSKVDKDFDFTNFHENMETVEASDDETFCIIDEPLKQETCLYLFSRTDRQKEDWYRKFVHAMKHSSRQPSDEALEAELERGAKPEVTVKRVAEYAFDDSCYSNVNVEFVSPSALLNADMNYIAFMNKFHLQLIRDRKSDKVATSLKLDREVECDVMWINALLGRILYDVLQNPVWIEKIQSKIQKKLTTIKLPLFVEELLLTGIELGRDVPMIHRASRPILDDHGLWVDLDITFEGCIILTIETKINLMKLKKESANLPADPVDEQPASPPNGQETPKKSKSPIYDSSVEDSAESSPTETDEEHRLSSSDDAEIPNSSGSQALPFAFANDVDAPTIPPPPIIVSPTVGTTPDKKKSSVVPGKGVIKMMNKFVSSQFFQSASENKYIKRAIEGMSNTQITLTVEIRACTGQLAVNFPPPPSDRMWFGFRGNPRLWISVKPKFGHRQVNISYVTSWLEKKLLQEFQKKFVLPNMDDLVITPMRTDLPI